MLAPQTLANDERILRTSRHDEPKANRKALKIICEKK